MKRAELIDEIRERVSGVYSPDEALVVAYVIAERFFGFDRIQAVTEPDTEVAGLDEDKLSSICGELSHSRPLEYVTGVSGFYGLTFNVREGVLIPRPETEELIHWIVNDHKASKGLRVLDVGTGSGAIAIALADNLCGPSVDAVDISEKALGIAAENAARNNVSVGFMLSDALSPLDAFMEAGLGGEYDVIVSNPPYIPASEYNAIRDNVREYEPHEALFVPDDDPLLFYREIAHKAMQLLVPGGKLYFEIHDVFSEDVAELLSSTGFDDIVRRDDINGKPRMVRCTKKI